MFNNLNVETINFRKIFNKVPSSKYITHAYHSYPGQLIPQIPYYYLTKYNKLDENSLILDPFCGAGTVLVEAMHTGWNSLGIDINPIATLISKVKTTPINPNTLKYYLNKIKHNYNSLNKTDVILPNFENVEYWFDKEKIINISKLKKSIELINEKDIKDFFIMTFSSIIKDVSKADPRIYVPVIPYDGYKKQQHDVFKLFLKRSMNNIMKMSEFILLLDDPYPKCIVINSDIKSYNDVTDNIDLVITSPPYISAQKYVRSTRLEAYWLDYDKDEQLKINKNTIGSESINKKYYSKIQYTNIDYLDNIITDIYEINPIRAGIVTKYFNDMKIVIKCIYQMLNSEGKFILVIGDNTVTGKEILTSEILCKISESEGFFLNRIIKDKIISRGMMTKRNKTAGLINYEWIFELQK